MLFSEGASPAVLRQERVGRGYGITLVEVFDLALFGKGVSYHVLRADGKPLCGVRGNAHSPEVGVDARADRVANRAVCVNCRDLMPPVPTPRLEREQS